MAKLIYTAITSLDGYIADEDGNFDWVEPDEEVHTFINDLQRSAGMYLYGRRMYEVMVYWETLPLADQPHFVRDFAALWQVADRIVYSRTPENVSAARTRIVRDFDPEAVRRMKAEATHDLTVGGPDVASPCVHCRVGRRVASIRHAHHRGRRQTEPAQQGPPAARAAGRAQVRQWRGLPPVPHQNVRTWLIQEEEQPTLGRTHPRLSRCRPPLARRCGRR